MSGALGKKISLPWPQIDKIKLHARWLEGEEQVNYFGNAPPVGFRITRTHEGIERGVWDFEMDEKNKWYCVFAEPQYLRAGTRIRRKRDPRAIDVSEIPEDVKRKAKEFLATNVKLLSVRATRRLVRLRSNS
jgi:hypothetical protein